MRTSARTPAGRGGAGRGGVSGSGVLSRLEHGLANEFTKCGNAGARVLLDAPERRRSLELLKLPLVVLVHLLEAPAELALELALRLPQVAVLELRAVPVAAHDRDLATLRLHAQLQVCNRALLLHTQRTQRGKLHMEACGGGGGGAARAARGRLRLLLRAQLLNSLQLRVRLGIDRERVPPRIVIRRVVSHGHAQQAASTAMGIKGTDAR